ncbi:MAG: class I SAM-dependent RNA methyltransferase [Actinobacteria bacterium]|nr:class I SAM-dependent RNA methyltransferase [Actinomycetota bacterium]
MTTVELTTTAMAVGGEAVAREPSGRVVFVAGGMPGERVLVELVEERKTFARGAVVEVLDPSPDRVEPSCPHRRAGCGGCDWQHIAPDAQRTFRLDVVRSELERALGRAPEVVLGPAVPPVGGRTTVRGTVGVDGRFAYRQRRSNVPIEVDSCLVAHPLVEEVVAAGRFGDAREVTIRAGARTGERLVVVDGDADEVRVPDDVLVVTTAELAAGRRAWIHEEVAGRTWRVSAGSFFQAGAEAADALVEVVRGAVTTHAPDDARLVDLCCGVGLFAGTLGSGRRVVGVERDRSAVADARHNLADLDVRLVRVAMERWRPSRADIVVADPARAGLGAAGVRAVDGTRAGLCVLVSCDVGALRRDVGLLAGVGFEMTSATTLDLFAHTGRVEVVSVLQRS